MERLTLFKRILALFIVVPVVSCYSDYKYEANAIEPEFGPITAKEKRFVRKLDSLGYENIKIVRPLITKGGSIINCYSVRMNSKTDLCNADVDSLIKSKSELGEYIYTDVIEDSLAQVIVKIKVDIVYENSCNRRINRRAFYQDVYIKDIINE